MINLHDKAITEILPKVGVKAFAVLLVICKHLNRKNAAFPSKLTIMKLTGMGRDAVTRELTVLEDAGLLRKEQRNKAGKFSTNLYTVTTNLIGVYVPANDAGEMEDAPCTESQATETPETELPCTESPSSESPSSESPCTESQATISIKQEGSIEQEEVLKREKGAPAKIENPNFVDVAKQMEEYVTNGDGKGQWDAMAKAQGFTGKPITILMNWAGKASPYQLRNWKDEIPRLQSWMRNEARADYRAKTYTSPGDQPVPISPNTRVHKKKPTERWKPTPAEIEELRKTFEG